MARYIDADAFIKMMEERCDHTASLDEWVLAVCRGGIKTMPTVELIRCKECQHYVNVRNRLTVNGSQGKCESLGMTYTHSEWYCGNAERRDDDGKNKN